jgi:uridine kinase
VIPPSTPAQAVAEVAARLSGLSGTRWVGVDGRGASGKTTLAYRIAVALPGAQVISVDDFARPHIRGWELARFLRQVRDPLLAGRAARYQRWDFAADLGADWVDVQPGRPVVVEGVSATDVRLGLPWDVTLWVDAPIDVRQRRALARDGEAMRERWLTDWIPSEEDYVRRQQPQQRADLVVDGGDV